MPKAELGSGTDLTFSILRTCPSPGRSPRFVTYTAPSAPIVKALGDSNPFPLRRVVRVPSAAILMTEPSKSPFQAD